MDYKKGRIDTFFNLSCDANPVVEVRDVQYSYVHNLGYSIGLEYVTFLAISQWNTNHKPCSILWHTDIATFSSEY